MGQERPLPPRQRPGRVTIGDVGGGIIGSIIAGGNVIQQKVTNVFADRESERARREQLILIDRVRTFWVKGVLERSVHAAALLELGKQVETAAVERPWGMLVESGEGSGPPAVTHRRITELFDEAGRALLILGDPGAGKTITLLELARDTLDRAERARAPTEAPDVLEPIPVILHLSSWGERKPDLASWVVTELNARYEIPKALGRRWLGDNDLMLLPDGLDEVEATRQTACVEAINRFREEQGLTAIAVCSRTTEYRALATQLKLRGAVLLQPLSTAQVDAYMAASGSRLETLRRALQEDGELRVLTQSPLMLSVMSLAYQDVEPEALKPIGSASRQGRYDHVFGAYVDRMFKRRGGDDQAHQQQTMRRLSWLAWTMARHDQSVLMIEQLQPSWLSTRAERGLYLFASRVMGSLVIALALALLTTTFAPGWVAVLMGLALLVWAWGAGVAIALVDGWRFERARLEGKQQGGRDPGWPPTATLATTCVVAALGGLAAYLGALVLAFRDWHMVDLLVNPFKVLSVFGLKGQIFAILCTVSFGLFFGWRARGTSARSDVRTVESIAWAWRRFLIPFLAVGVIPGLLTLVIAAALRNPNVKLWDGQGRFVALLDSFADEYEEASFSPDATMILTSGRDGMRLWHAKDGSVAAAIPESGRPPIPESGRFPIPSDWAGAGILANAWAGRRILAGTIDGVRIWDAQEGRLVATISTHVDYWSVNLSQQGYRIATLQNWDTVRLWDAADGQLLTKITAPGLLHSSFNKDGTRILICPDIGGAQLWDAQDGRLIAALETDVANDESCLFSTDGTRIVTDSKDGRGRVWDARDGRLVTTLEGITGRSGPWPLRVGADGSRILKRSRDGSAWLWDGRNGELLATIERGIAGLVRFSPDGSRFATAGDDGVARLWSAQDGMLVARLEPDGPRAPMVRTETYPIFDPRGSRVLTLRHGDTVRLWDSKDGAPIATLDEGHTFLGAFFSPDGTRLMTVTLHRDGHGVNNSARLWDSAAGALLATMRGVGKGSFSPDGTRILTLARPDGRTWDYRPASPLVFCLGLVTGVFAGLQRRVRKTKTRPNQGILLSGRNAILVGLAVGVSFALLAWAAMVAFKPSDVSTLRLPLVVLGLSGVMCVLWYGGYDVLEHLVLRALLARRGHLPWNIARFLDQAVDRILLRKVGGGYVFVHRLLQEYFARGDDRTAI